MEIISDFSVPPLLQPSCKRSLKTLQLMCLAELAIKSVGLSAERVYEGLWSEPCVKGLEAVRDAWKL